MQLQTTTNKICLFANRNFSIIGEIDPGHSIQWDPTGHRYHITVTQQTVCWWPQLADKLREAPGVLCHVWGGHRCAYHEGSGHTGEFVRVQLFEELSCNSLGDWAH